MNWVRDETEKPLLDLSTKQKKKKTKKTKSQKTGLVLFPFIVNENRKITMVFN